MAGRLRVSSSRRDLHSVALYSYSYQQLLQPQPRSGGWVSSDSLAAAAAAAAVNSGAALSPNSSNSSRMQMREEACKWRGVTLTPKRGGWPTMLAGSVDPPMTRRPSEMQRSNPGDGRPEHVSHHRVAGERASRTAEVMLKGWGH